MVSSLPISPLRYEILSRLNGGHTGGVAAVAFSPRGTYLATAGLDSRVCIWTLSDQKLSHMVRGSKRVLCLVWLQNQDDTLLYGIEDGGICVLRITPVSPVSSLRLRPALRSQ